MFVHETTLQRCGGASVHAIQTLFVIRIMQKKEEKLDQISLE